MVVPRLRRQWQQVKGRRQARPCRLGTQAKQQGCMLVHRVLLHQGHRPDMPHRPGMAVTPGTQATHRKLSTSNSKTENHSVPRPRSSIGQVPRVRPFLTVNKNENKTWFRFRFCRISVPYGRQNSFHFCANRISTKTTL